MMNQTAGWTVGGSLDGLSTQHGIIRLLSERPYLTVLAMAEASKRTATVVIEVEGGTLEDLNALIEGDGVGDLFARKMLMDVCTITEGWIGGLATAAKRVSIRSFKGVTGFVFAVMAVGDHNLLVEGDGTGDHVGAVFDNGDLLLAHNMTFFYSRLRRLLRRWWVNA